MTKRFGFTLAEVLITLGIIGVVAAMTIPTLIANTNGAKFRAQFKKTLSTLNQAGLMAQAQYDFDYAGATAACSTTATEAAAENPENVMTFCSLLNGTLTGHTYNGKASTVTRANSGSSTGTTAVYASTKILGDSVAIKDFLTYSLADGSIVGFADVARTSAACELTLGDVMNSTWIDNHKTTCLGFIDVNGATLPNKEVNCSEGTTGQDVGSPCAVKNDANHMTDIFPIVFHDATVEPATNAAKYVLTTSK